MQTTTLSAIAVAVLRFEIKGYRSRVPGRRLVAYRELAAAGIMEQAPGSETDYRFTAEGMEHREAILEREAERIERERYDPPDVSNLSEAAGRLLRRIVTGEHIEITPGNRPAFRELSAARVVILGHSFARGNESVYQFTYWGWKQRFELVERASPKRLRDRIDAWLQKR
jgi:antitoxin (DNA-binding transcriptional repressor) of toxin-antitoxin stability system